MWKKKKIPKSDLLAFSDHLEDLRSTLIYSILTILIATFIAFFFYEDLFAILMFPVQQDLLLLKPLEGFVTAIKVAFWSGVIFSSPLWLFFLIRFLLPALQPKERKMILPFLLLSTLFFAAGILFAYYCTLPLVFQFFTTFNDNIGINAWSLSSTLDTIILIMMGHALAFELVFILLLLVHFRILSYAVLKKSRKYVIVLIFILGAVLTPPDVVSQLLLAFPLWGFFELIVLYAKAQSHFSNARDLP